MNARDEFLYPRSRYRGQIEPANLVFNANLQEFAQRTSYIVNLETGGKISAKEAYQRLKTLWQQFEFASQQLEIANKLSASHERDD